MPAPEGLVISRVLPDEAFAVVRPLQELWVDSYRTVYVGELGVEMNIMPEPISIADPEHTEGDPYDSARLLQREIEYAGDLSSSQQDAFMIARHPSRTKYGGIVGVSKLTRIEDDMVVIHDLTVAPDLRGRRIGTAILNAAFDTLDIDGNDTLNLTVLQQNIPARLFWYQLGFARGRGTYHFSAYFPNPANFHLEHNAPQPIVAERVHERLAA